MFIKQRRRLESAGREAFVARAWRHGAAPASSRKARAEDSARFTSVVVSCFLPQSGTASHERTKRNLTTGRKLNKLSLNSAYKIF